ncbi:MAG TPA: C10 family peptidase [Bacteroidales bacterium]|nr:C10 family peptidase [Bacteroidales bacterium]
MKYLLFTVVFSFSFIFLTAQHVSRDYALQTGINFYKSHAMAFDLNKSDIQIEKESTITSKSGKDCIYEFSFKDGGYILVSADNRAYPVLAYSYGDEFDIEDIAPATRLWIDKYLEQFDLIESNSIKSTDIIKSAWQKYYNNETPAPRSIRGVPTMLTTKWNQNYPYNYYCPMHPLGPGQRVYAGCVATAMAQVMKFWNYPETGRGTHDYFWGDYFTVDFGETTYHWDSMTNSINTLSRNSIAELIFHCAVSVDMDFGPDGSGSSISNSFFALKQNFRYRAGVYELEKYDVEDSEWKFILREDLDKGHPILYRGTNDNGEGHAFVCDGYQDTSYFHFNWGWGGSANGYFYLDNINPRMSFYWGQGALINLTPNYADYCSSMVYDQPEWSFDDGSGPNYYFNNTDCDWLISLGNREFDFLRIYFTKYDLLENDILKIYEGNSSEGALVGTFTAGVAPSELISYSNEIYITFKTDSQGQAEGWKLNYETIVLGVNSNSINSDISIYPNPAKEEIYVYGLDSESNLTILDMCGRIIYCDNNFIDSEINISEFESGIYILKIENQDFSKILKFIKE